LGTQCRICQKFPEGSRIEAPGAKGPDGDGVWGVPSPSVGRGCPLPTPLPLWGKGLGQCQAVPLLRIFLVFDLKMVNFGVF